MYIAEFVSKVSDMRQAQIKRKSGDRQAAIDAWELEKEVDRGLAEGVTVVEPVEQTEEQITNSEAKNGQ